MLNSLYGKLGESNVKVIQKFAELVTDDDVVVGEFSGNNLHMINIDEITETAFSYLHIASYITSTARAYLLNRTFEIIKKGGIVFYHDTDSNFF